MKVVVLGKPGGITRLTEDIAEDFRIGQHTVSVLATRNPALNRSLERILLNPRFGAPLAAWTARRVKHIAPDLMLAVGVLGQFSATMMEHLAALPGRPPLIGWIGDVFTERDAAVANCFDIICYTDTGMVAMHAQLGFRSKAVFLPLGASRGLPTQDAPGPRSLMLAIAAAPTPERRDLLAQISEPINIFGPGWQAKGMEVLSHHKRDARRIDAPELAKIYARHMGALNIRNEINVINGLNQRHFAPYTLGTPVITDSLPDISTCFDPGHEILVYRDAPELNEIYAALRRDPSKAAAIGAAGQRRVLAQHTYSHRLLDIANMIGIKTEKIRSA